MALFEIVLEEAGRGHDNAGAAGKQRAFDTAGEEADRIGSRKQPVDVEAFVNDGRVEAGEELCEKGCCQHIEVSGDDDVRRGDLFASSGRPPGARYDRFQALEEGGVERLPEIHIVPVHRGEIAAALHEADDIDPIVAERLDPATHGSIIQVVPEIGDFHHGVCGCKAGAGTSEF